MASPLTKLLRDELSTEKLQSLQAFKLLEISKQVSSAAAQGACVSREAREVLLEALSRLSREAQLLGAFRGAKAALGADVPSDTADAGVLEAIKRLVAFLSELYSGSLLLVGNKLVVKFVTSCEGLRAGDIVLMDFARAAFLHARGCADPLPRPFAAALLRADQSASAQLER